MSKAKKKGFSGSGKGGNSTPYTAPQSGTSQSTAYLLGAVSEGEVEGPVEGVKGVYFNETPLQNSDGSFNFTNFAYGFVPGTQSQSLDISSAADVSSSIGVNADATFNPFVLEFQNTVYETLYFIVRARWSSLEDIPGEYPIWVGNIRYLRPIQNLLLSVPDIKYKIEYSFNNIDWIFFENGTLIFEEDALKKFESTDDWFTDKTHTIPIPKFTTIFIKLTHTTEGYVEGNWGHPNGDYPRFISFKEYYNKGPGFGKQVAIETPVATEVKGYVGGNFEEENTATHDIVRSFNNSNLSAIKVKLSFQLQEITDEGDVYGHRLDYRIWLKEGNNPFQRRIANYTEGRYPSATEFDFTIPLLYPVNESNPNYVIRVRRTSPEATDKAKDQRVMNFVSYTQVSYTNLSYPNTAIGFIQVNTEYFPQIPSVAIKLAGRKIRIPSNATIQANLPNKPDVRYLTYSGNWNGTFHTPTQACSDPAWILYDLLTHTRYGLGNYIDTTQIDKWSLYEISKYCNGLVPDGSGGQEPRFTCNVKLEGKVEAYQVIQSLVSIFRGFAYWQAGAICFAVDKQDSVVHQFTQADIEEGSFTYSRTGLKSRKTIAVVSYLNPLNFYKKAVEVVEDPIGVQKWGNREMELEAIACTSRGQARRAGVAALLTNRLEHESVTFRARAFAAYVKPGDLIRIYDSKRTSARYAGIIKSATATTITLDSPVNLPAGTNYTITVTTSNLIKPSIDGGNNLADPSQNQRLRFEVKEASIQSRGTNLSVLTLEGAGFGNNVPPPESNWVIQGGDISNTIYRVINRSPIQDSIEGMHEILAVEYNQNKYSFIDDMQFPLS